jgi:amino acid adenylation domain-containing protein
MLQQYQHLLAQISENSATKISEYSLAIESLETKNALPDAKRLLNCAWHGAVQEIFAQQAKENPAQIALIDPNETWTYQQLETRANQLANLLQEKNIGRQDIVAIYAHRSATLVWALLGVLKAGAAFLILDPAYPASRLVEYLQAAEPRAFIAIKAAGPIPAEIRAVTDSLAARINLTKLAEVAADGLLENLSSETPNINFNADDIAYIAFTSGSTGKPKGVIGRHGSLSHFLPWRKQTFNLTKSDRHSMLSGLSHDPLHRDIFLPLSLGATICAPDPDQIHQPGKLADWLIKTEIAIANLTPAMCQLITGHARKNFTAASLRYAFFVGDQLTINEVTSLKRLFPEVQCVNYYGATETQQALSYFPISDNVLAEDNIIPLGKGCEDVQLLLLNSAHQLAGVGEIGEIYFRSPFLAQGYLNDEQLTAQRFIVNPFTGADQDRLYRTGDLGRYLPDGNILFLGRADNQVKVRGYRIELGEIEMALLAHPSIKEAVVIVREDEPGNKRLAAYLVANQTTPTMPTIGELREFLKTRLPDYMVPSVFVMMESIPLTANGKIDRRALPAPEQRRMATAENYVGPRTPIEEMVAKVWRDVLKLERVGAHDNFFELGGHSLLATQVISRVRGEFGIEMPLRALFERSSVGAMAEEIEQRLREDKEAEVLPIAAIPRVGELPLSFAQQRLWFLDQLVPNSPAWNIFIAANLKGRVNIEVLARSINEVIARQEVLRTGFVVVDGMPQLVISPAKTLSLPLVDLRMIPENSRDAELQRLAAEESQKTFNLADSPLLRATLLQLSDNEHVLFLTFHHIIADGWSSAILVREIATFYQAFSQGKVMPLNDLPIQYIDFANWQRQYLQGETLEKQIEFWKQRLAGVEFLQLPTDRPRPPVQTSNGRRYPVTIPKELADNIELLGNRERASLFMTLLSAFYLLLYRYSNQEDITIGSPFANREHAELESLIGFFVNTLVLRVNVSGEVSFREFLAQVREITLAAYAHKEVPFEHILEVMRQRQGNNAGYTPLFQVAFILNNFPVQPIELPDLALTPLNFHSDTAKFDLNFSLTKTDAGLIGWLEYNSDLFDESTIAGMVMRYQLLLSAAIAHPDEMIGRLPFITEAERHSLLSRWQDNGVEDEKNICIHQLFEEQVLRAPDSIAAIYENERISYRELNRRANQLAHYLEHLGVGPETLVGICLERSLSMVVSILGVLKAGGAYLPLDPFYPKDRLAFMLADSQVPVLIAEEKQEKNIPQCNARIVFLDRDAAAIAEEREENPTCRAQKENIAYVIYTSGSTGKPKGVLIEHRNVVRLFSATDPWFNFNESDVWTLFHSYAFDFSVWELWGALLYGGRLVVVPYLVSRSPEAFRELLLAEQVTVLNQTPSAFRQLIKVEESLAANNLLALRYVVFGGEALDPQCLTPWFDRYGDKKPQLINMYGITETTVHVTYRPLSREDLTGGSVIGRPIPDLQLYILDKYLQPEPVGIAGEIYVGGAGPGRGYLNRDELTRERFIPDHFNSNGHRRLYKAGDLARYLSNGDIEYLGRIDQQVKIRGFRIELGEIEALLNSHASVWESLVMVRKDMPDDQRLIAYVVFHKDRSVPVSELREFLAKQLPDYMLPSNFITLDTFPLNQNGKIDRQALPLPDDARPELQSEFVAPRSPAEEAVAKIWREVLNIDRVGVYDRFFELGGHSLLLTQLASRLRADFEIDLPLRELFDIPTVAEMTKAILARQVNQANPQDVAAMIDKLKNLSPEEIEALLGSDDSLMI